MNKTKKYQITLTEEQLMLMARCVDSGEPIQVKVIDYGTNEKR